MGGEKMSFFMRMMVAMQLEEILPPNQEIKRWN